MAEVVEQVPVARWALPLWAEDAPRDIIMASGRAVGKDYACGDFALTKMKSHQDYHVVCMRQFQNSIADSIKAVMERRIKAHGWDDVFTITNTEIICKATGSRMTFRGYERNTESLKGLEGVCLAIINEAQTVTEEAVRLFRYSVREESSRFLWIGNPRYRTDYFTQMLNNPPPGALVLRPTQADNPWLPEVMRLEMEADRGKPWFANVWGGELVSLQGSVFDAGRVLPRERWGIGQCHRVRAWDLAGTAGGGDYTVGVLMALKDGEYQIQDVVRGQWDSGEVRNKVRYQTAADTMSTTVVIERGPADAGLRDQRDWARMLAGYDFRSERPTGHKAERARGFAAAVNNNLVSYVADAPWWNDLAAELASFSEDPSSMRGRHDDQVDACSAAFNCLVGYAGQDLYISIDERDAARHKLYEEMGGGWRELW